MIDKIQADVLRGEKKKEVEKSKAHGGKEIGRVPILSGANFSRRATDPSSSLSRSFLTLYFSVICDAAAIEKA